MKQGLSGFVFAKNAIKLDYCLELAARSLLPVVDELILCDSNSTDGTTDLMHSIKGANVINYNVENPIAHPWWDLIWRNFVRARCNYEMHICLDADEVLDNREESHLIIRKLRSKTRLSAINFWIDENTLSPSNTCCADLIVRVSPSDKFCQYGDQFPFFPPDEPFKDEVNVSVFHLGYLRKMESFFEKTKITHAPHGSTVNGKTNIDPRVEKAFESNLKLHEIDWGWDRPLREYKGHYPPGVLDWIRERKT